MYMHEGTYCMHVTAMHVPYTCMACQEQEVHLPSACLLKTWEPVDKLVVLVHLWTAAKLDKGWHNEALVHMSAVRVFGGRGGIQIGGQLFCRHHATFVLNVVAHL